MSIKVGIIDFGLGNLFSINNACQQVGLETVITANPKVIKNVDALILPGVGAFGDAMNELIEKNITSAILDFVKTGKPFLGICLGMQLLFSESAEFGNCKGLDLIKGKIVKFPTFNGKGIKVCVPQIQWNQIYSADEGRWSASSLKNLSEGTFMYFVHSYYAIPEDRDVILSKSEYEGISYTSAVIKDNITGYQYHPEKSGKEGIKVYENWANQIKKKTN